MTTVVNSPAVSKALEKLATVHGVNLTSQIDLATGCAFDTLLGFQEYNTAYRKHRKALKESDITTADECAISMAMAKDDNRQDARAILKASRNLSRRERALLVVAACKGI